MPLVYKDRVKETSLTTGVGTYTLAGAAVGFQGFSVIGNSNTVEYCAYDGTTWEVGLGTYLEAGATLARTLIYDSSNAGAAVSWGAGTKTIIGVWPAFRAAFTGTGNLVREISPTLVTPVLGLAVATTLNTHTIPGGTGTLALVGDVSAWVDDNLVAGVDIEKVKSGAGTELNPTQFTIHNTRKIQTLSDAATITLDLMESLGSTKILNVAGNRVIAFVNARVGQIFEARLIYDVVGGRVVTWPATVMWVNGYTPAYSPTGGGSDTFEFQRIASSGAVQYIGSIKSTEHPVILYGQCSVAGSEDIDWSICNGKIITLLPGTGTYTLRHVRPTPGQFLTVNLIAQGAIGSTIWTDVGIGVTVDWGVAGPPRVPPDGYSHEFRFRCETINLIRGERRWVDTGYTVIEVRTDDPVDLVEGRMWFRSDL